MVSTAAVQSPADAANLALTRMGYRLRIGSLYDGSLAAKKLLDVYAQTRDALLRSFDWQFAERNLKMTVLKSAPAGGYFPPSSWDQNVNPSLPWQYEYAYPSDCLKVRAVKPPASFVQNFDPQPTIFSVENDPTFTPPQRVIMCNVQDAVLVYTAQITNPTTWDVGFVEAFSADLAKHVSAGLLGKDGYMIEAADAKSETAEAQTEQG